MAKFLLYLTLTSGLSACATPFVDYPIGVLEHPTLIPIPPDQQARAPLDVLDTCAANQETLKNHILRYEARIKTHDEAL